jgi:hypothetical protein
MKELFIDFAASFLPEHPISRAIADLSAGDAVALQQYGGHVHIVNQAGIKVARLAGAAKTKLQDQLGAIKSVKVVALATRYKGDIVNEPYLQRCKQDRWEVPIIELKMG